MGARLAIVLALGLALPAHAGDKDDLVASIADSLTLILAGDFDTFLSKHVDPLRTDGPHAVENWKSYSLKRAKRSAKGCLVAGAVNVSSWRGDPVTEDRVTVYIECGEGLPRPSSHRRVNGVWKITNISW